MSKVLINEWFQYGMKKPKRSYAIYGGLIPPFTMELNGNKYIMPGWYKLSKDEELPNIKDIAFYPYKPKKDHIPNIDKDKVYKVLSSRGDNEYEVKMGTTGSMECTCPGYGFRRECRHIKDIISSSI